MSRIINYLKQNRKLLISMSSFNGFFLGTIKVLLAIISKSFSLFVSSFYNFGIGMAKKNTIRDNQSPYENIGKSGLIVVLSSTCYIGYSYYVYRYGSKIDYHLYIGILIAAITFTDLFLAIMGLIKANKNNDLELKSIKCLNLATSVISLSLTQTALLSVTVEKDMSQYNGISGMFFGIFAVLIGIYMFIVGNSKCKR